MVLSDQRDACQSLEDVGSELYESEVVFSVWDAMVQFRVEQCCVLKGRQVRVLCSCEKFDFFLKIGS